MSNYGIFNIFEFTMMNTDIQVRMAGASILFQIVEYDPNLIRSFCVAQNPEGRHFFMSRATCIIRSLD